MPLYVPFIMHGCMGSSYVESWWHQMETFSTLLAICAGKGQSCTALMFSLICTWINSWANTLAAGDLRCNHTHYDITPMISETFLAMQKHCNKRELRLGLYSLELQSTWTEWLIVRWTYKLKNKEKWFTIHNKTTLKYIWFLDGTIYRNISKLIVVKT